MWVFVKWQGADASVYYRIYKRVYRPGNKVTSKWSIIMSDIYLQKANKNNLQKTNYFFTSLIE